MKIGETCCGRIVTVKTNRNGQGRHAANMSNIIQSCGATTAITFACATSYASAAADRRKKPNGNGHNCASLHRPEQRREDHRRFTLVARKSLIQRMFLMKLAASRGES
jgi:hypothetical protein